MPWNEVSAMSLRAEFVMLATDHAIPIRELCRRFGISSRTAYKWLHRFAQEGPAGLVDRSRTPRHSPRRMPPEVETAVAGVRREHPAWGGRTIEAWLKAHGAAVVPSSATITAILRRHGLLEADRASAHRPWQRFEQNAPNQLWQMDFKGHFALAQGRCHPLTVLDDHSRFALGVEACADETGATTKERLTGIFRRYGLPERMLMDHGSPWSSDPAHPHTPLTVWLMRLGVSVSHGRPYHPQTQGKEERFHRTLKAEVLQGRSFRDLAHCQEHFDRWREVYNCDRPHQALDLVPPVRRYRPSERGFPEALPPIEYGPGDEVRKVQAGGEIWFKGHPYQVSQAFLGLPVAIRPTSRDGAWEVYFLTHLIHHLDQRNPAGAD